MPKATPLATNTTTVAARLPSGAQPCSPLVTATIPKKPTLQDCEWFKESADLFKAEYEARRNYDKECYAGGDKGHITQSSSKNAAENKCLSIYKECLKRAKKQNKCLVK